MIQNHNFGTSRNRCFMYYGTSSGAPVSYGKMACMLNRNFHSNVNVLGRFYKQFLTSVYRSTLFGIFFKPDSKQKYLQVEQSWINSLKDLFFASKYGYVRANTDICPVFALSANNQHWLLAIIGHAKTNILQQNMYINVRKNNIIIFTTDEKYDYISIVKIIFRQ
jgi:hypothetical protein